MSEFHEIVIVGAGASGMMCGYFLGKKGLDVVILDKNVSAGKKLLATGNGRCNFTNRVMKAGCYYGDMAFVKSVIGQVSDQKVIDLFEEIGIHHREREGYCYPYSGQAAAVVKLLEQGCVDNQVLFRFDTRVTKVVHKDDIFTVKCKDGKEFKCRKLILACGGKAYESLGGDGSGYKLCRSLGHHVTDIYPGLTGLQAGGKEWKQLAGVRMQGAVSLYSDSSLVRREQGEIQIVKDGISGIPVFQLCRLAAEELGAGKAVSVCLDFFPQMSEEELEQWLRMHGTEKLCGLIHTKWIDVMMKRCGGTISKLVRLLKAYEVGIQGTFGIERAQVTAGGVVAGEIDPETMQSKICNGLYILGELLDVDGICGGYNLHFAWSTAYLCAKGIGKERENVAIESV